MSVPVWQPNTLTPPGSFVRPTSVPAQVATQPANGGFESLGAGWTAAGPGTWDFPGAITGADPFSGVRMARYVLGGTATLTSGTEVPVTPGQQIEAVCYARVEGTSSPDRYAKIGIQWLDSLGAVIATSFSIEFNGPGGIWSRISTGVTSAPAGAEEARIVLEADVGTLFSAVLFDAVSWDYSQVSAGAGLLFRAVQDNTGLTGSVEPDWPATAGLTVEDNEVTWEAVTDVFDSVVWEASPILVSGATEPDWPTEVGAFVLDNTISWEAVSRVVTDERCPHSKVVAIAASKVFAADEDIIAFSATVNPLDWSTPEDAGYIPFGLQTYGETPVSGLGLYRSNLVAFNSQGFQMWQVDEDPQNMAILDAVPVGCDFFKSIHPVSNDLVFLTQQGIRNIAIAGASTNIQAGFFGKQIDPLVQEKLREAETEGYTPVGLFWPAAGQYWLFFQEEAFVLTMNGGKDDQHWSRYIFPAPVTDWTLFDDKLVMRSGTLVWEMDDSLTEDDVHSTDDGYGEYETVGTVIDGYVAWPYLDFGQLGREKQLYGFDVVFDGELEVSFGYDQRNFDVATDPYFLVPEDTLPGQPVPFPLAGPSFQIRFQMYPGAEAPWEIQAVALYVQDMRGGT